MENTNIITDENREAIKLGLQKSINSRGILSIELYNKRGKCPEIDDLLNRGYTLSILNHLITDGYDSFPKCLYCGKEMVYYWKRTSGCCSRECIDKSGHRVAKIKENLMAKFGVDNVSKLESVKKKKIETCKKHFGCDYPQQSEKVREKTVEAIKEKYGEEYTSTGQVPSLKEKIVETNRKKYGVDYAFQADFIKDKIVETNIKRYGVPYTLQSKEVMDKSKETNNQKYGVDYPSQSPEIMSKIKSSLRKYNFEAFENYLKERRIEMISSKEDFLSSEEKILKYKCLDCGKEFETFDNRVGLRCPHCSRQLYSKEEKDMTNFIRSFYSGEIEENNRKLIYPYEIDVYIPEKKVAFEFNGMYWHSTAVKPDKKVHQNKTLLCQERGIRLIHIFEYEWMEKQEICKSIIKSSLGYYDKRIYARKCSVIELSHKEYTDFLNENHLQGGINSSIRYGLIYDNELVSVIGFGKSRFKKGETELHRFCSKLNYNVIGGFSKLIKHSGISNFISFIDLSPFDGSGYEKIGFKKLNITQPNYKWCKGYMFLNRISTQKHKLANLLENFNPEISEVENMMANGYYQIFDSGNLKVSYNCENKLESPTEINIETFL